MCDDDDDGNESNEIDDGLAAYPLGQLPLLWQDCPVAFRQALDTSRTRFLAKADNYLMALRMEPRYGDEAEHWHPFRVLLAALRDTEYWSKDPERRLDTVAQLAPSVLQRLPQFNDHMPLILQGYATNADAARPEMWQAASQTWAVGEKFGQDNFYSPEPYAYRLGRALGMSEMQSWAAPLKSVSGIGFDAMNYWTTALEAASSTEGAACARLWLDGPGTMLSGTSQNRQIAAALCKWLLDPSRHAMAKDFAACVLKEPRDLKPFRVYDHLRLERIDLVYETCEALHLRDCLQAPEAQQALTQLQERARPAPASPRSASRRL